mgnify:CR=1 FL=1
MMREVLKPLILGLACAAALGTAARAEGPAGEVGASVCAGCHADKMDSLKSGPHGVRLDKIKGVPLEKACETCHGPGSLHAGAGGDKNSPDFNTIRNPAKLRAGDSAEICLSCHAGDKKRMFWSGSAHEGKGVACASCHKVHGANDHLLKSKGENELCGSCHRDVKAALLKRSKHPLRDGAMADGQGKMACSSCHNPHGAQGEKLISAKSVNDKCFQCHGEKKAPLLWEHGPVKEDCLICHNPHGSSNNKLLVTKVPRLCQQCHMQGRHQSGNLGADSVYAVGRACLNCHPMIHGSNNPSGPVLQR